jgi:hypothetical protein
MVVCSLAVAICVTSAIIVDNKSIVSFVLHVQVIVPKFITQQIVETVCTRRSGASFRKYMCRTIGDICCRTIRTTL